MTAQTISQQVARLDAERRVAWAKYYDLLPYIDALALAAYHLIQTSAERPSETTLIAAQTRNVVWRAGDLSERLPGNRPVGGRTNVPWWPAGPWTLDDFSDDLHIRGCDPDYRPGHALDDDTCPCDRYLAMLTEPPTNLGDRT